MILWLCILSNLIIGNAFIYRGGKRSFGGKPNYYLMAGMSVACIACYYYLFKNISFAHYGVFALAGLSILACITITVLGNIITSFIFDIRNSGLTWTLIPEAVFVGGLLGIIGCIGMFHMILLMGMLNIFWFLAAAS